METILLVGFDSAWTANRAGAVVGALADADRGITELGPPTAAAYAEAAAMIAEWQVAHAPTTTLITLDQPTVVPNSSGQRPVEHLVCSIVSRRRGGMQPAYTGKAAMFGAGAPIWPFLTRFGGTDPPGGRMTGARVIETYPALVLAALGWLHPDDRPTGRLPKYNPRNRHRFRLDDWRTLCRRTGRAFSGHGLERLTAWLEDAAAKPKPLKTDQDGLDACLCLLVALHLAHGRECLMVGDEATGYILVPYSEDLRTELEQRCRATGRAPRYWTRRVRLG